MNCAVLEACTTSRTVDECEVLSLMLFTQTPDLRAPNSIVLEKEYRNMIQVSRVFVRFCSSFTYREALSVCDASTQNNLKRHKLRTEGSKSAAVHSHIVFQNVR